MPPSWDGVQALVLRLFSCALQRHQVLLSDSTGQIWNRKAPKTVRNLYHSLSRYWGTGRGILEEEEEVESLYYYFLTRKCSVSTQQLFANLSNIKQLF